MLNAKTIEEILRAMDSEADQDPQGLIELQMELSRIPAVRLGLALTELIGLPSSALSLFGLGFQLGQRYAQVEALEALEAQVR